MEIKISKSEWIIPLIAKNVVHFKIIGAREKLINIAVEINYTAHIIKKCEVGIEYKSIIDFVFIVIKQPVIKRP